MNLKSFILRQFRKRVRVYILPTKMGGYLNGLIFLMFLLSVGYSNNLLLIFTLLLFGLNLIWVIQTHYFLRGLRPGAVATQNGHVGTSIPVQVRWASSPRGNLKWNLTLVREDHAEAVATHFHSEHESQGTLRFKRRGHYRWEHLKVHTDMPFGLYQVWIYFPVTSSTYAFPELSSTRAPVEVRPSEQEGELPVERAGSGEVSHLNSYHGEHSNRISWKHYARSGQLIIKEGEALRSSKVDFVLEPPAGALKEEYLSKLATQLVDCRAQGIAFTLKTSASFRGPACSDQHLVECLKEISVC